MSPDEQPFDIQSFLTGLQAELGAAKFAQHQAQARADWAHQRIAQLEQTIQSLEAAAPVVAEVVEDDEPTDQAQHSA